MPTEIKKSASCENWGPTVFTHKLIDLPEHQIHDAGIVLTRVHKSIPQRYLEIVTQAKSTGLHASQVPWVCMYA